MFYKILISTGGRFKGGFRRASATKGSAIFLNSVSVKLLLRHLIERYKVAARWRRDYRRGVSTKSHIKNTVPVAQRL